MNTGFSLLMTGLLALGFTEGSSAGEGKQKSDPKECGIACSPNQKESEVKSELKSVNPAEPVITTEGLKSLIGSHISLVILDARSGKYDDGRRIPGAKSLNAESGEKEVSKIIPSKNSLVITYCASLECPASGKLHERLSKLGYKHVIEYPWGIKGWVEGGNSVETVKHPSDK